MAGINPESIRRWLQNLQRAKKAVRAAAIDGVNQFAEHVLGESNDLCPVSPTDPKHPHYIGTSGALRDSGHATPAEIKDGVAIASVVYNTNYAAAVHERMDVSHQYAGAINPRAQEKFLETAINNNRENFLPFMTDFIKDALS